MNIKLKKARENEALTKLQLAEKAGISLRAYQYIELNGRLPNVQTAKLIAQALNSTVEDLF